MSANKFRYYEVTTTSTVQALNQADAISLSKGRRGVSGKSLTQDTMVSRITAAEARQNVEELSTNA